MIRRIIIEGADQQGKTTLCNALAKELGWDIVHFGKPAAEFDFLRGYNISEKTISDRSFLSEVVYSRINDRVSRAQPVFLCNKFRISDTLLIMMDREDSFIFDEDRHEDYEKDQIMMAISLYRAEFKKLNMEKMILNPNCESFDGQVKSIINACKW
jgi:deoxyadenosine/deoxycytidine kinase